MSQIYNVAVAADGTIKLPQDVREELGGDSLDQVIFLVRNGAVYMVPNPMTFEGAAESIPPLRGTSLDLDDEIEAAMEEELWKKYR
jgi:bifunctional DNA-binding transcriptional regulator/antitoxin component of YhaV-PrlF toxin-antitoxin module